MVTWEQLYERVERELVAGRDRIGLKIENNAAGDHSSRLKGQGLETPVALANDHSAAERLPDTRRSTR